MLRYLIFRAGSASLGFMLMLPLGHGASRPTGFDETPTPGERQLAAAAVPDGYFREMTGLWHGAPGLEALQTRWRTFAATEPGFAVLAALVEESAGRPQVALEQMKLLPGSGARWQEGRLLALLGREGEAVAVLEKLVAEGEDLGVAAEALLALTELDCIRGEFARGLVRSGGAWQGRVEEGFRLKILERHLSLLVEAGQERDFLEGQLAVANGEGVKEVRETARKVLTVMADWFTGDARLREIQKEMGRDFYTGVAGARMPGMVHLRPSLSCGVLHPRGSEVVLELLAANSTEEVESALEKAPVWRERLKAQPLQMAVHLLQWDQQRKGLPGVARWMVGAVEAGPVRRAVELIERAWAGKAGPEDVEVLSGIIVEAGRARGMRPAYPLGRSGKGMAFVGLDDYPSAEIVWNLQGPRWAEFYAMSCRCFPLFKITHGDNHFEAAKFGGWSDWRPSWPVDGVEPLTVWAWRQLLLCGQGTRERAERIAQQMGDAGDRVLFAALCRQDALLVKWLQEKEFVREVNSSALMQALNTLQLGMGDARPSEAQAEVVLTVAREMARRLELPPLDLIRMNERFYRFASPSMREEMAARPVDPVLAAILDGHYDDHAVQALRRQRSVAPYPLYNLPLCPSVERFRALAVALEKPRPGTYVPTGHFGMPRPALELLLGWAYRSRDYFLNLPATLQEIAEFPSKHPLKESVQKWRQAMPVVERKGGLPSHFQIGRTRKVWRC